jgi:hypothetical protein
MASQARANLCARSVADCASRRDHSYQPEDTFADGDSTYKTRARVSTSDGKTFRSRRLSVAELLQKLPDG